MGPESYHRQLMDHGFRPGSRPGQSRGRAVPPHYKYLWSAMPNNCGAYFTLPVEHIARKELIPAVSFIRWCNTTKIVSTISQTKSFILDKNPIKSSILLRRQIKHRLMGLPRSKKCWAHESEAGSEGPVLLLASPRLPGLRVLLQKSRLSITG